MQRVLLVEQRGPTGVFSGQPATNDSFVADFATTSGF